MGVCLADFEPPRLKSYIPVPKCGFEEKNKHTRERNPIDLPMPRIYCKTRVFLTMLCSALIKAEHMGEACFIISSNCEFDIKLRRRCVTIYEL